MNYDVLILGGGIVGCTVAYELSKFNLNIALIEKAYDVAEDISTVSTSVVYDGSETSNEKIAEYEKIGIKLIEDACDKFNVPYKKVGALRVASDDNGVIKLNDMYNRAKERGINNISLIDKCDFSNIDKNLNICDAKLGLYSEDVAIISPYELAIAYAEVAVDNGVNFRFEENVLDISQISKGFKVITNKNKFTCRVVINTIPNKINIDNNLQGEVIVNYNEDNVLKNMNYILVDKDIENPLEKIIINVLDDNKFAMSIPNIYGGYIMGIKDTKELSREDRINNCKRLNSHLNKDYVTSMLNDVYEKDVMYIDDSRIADGYISVTGTHYGKLVIAPGIAKKISSVIADNMKTTLKKDFIDKRRDVYKFKEMTPKERNELIALDNRYGRIICTCNQITEGEIVDCIRRPLGARTLAGIKRRTGACIGDCSGSRCNRLVMNILARETDKKVCDIVEDSKNFTIWNGRVKEFDNV